MDNRKLKPGFYLLPDVVEVAKQLLGKMLITHLHGKRTSGIITETEAYAGATDKASHAYGTRLTQRTKPMFGTGGHAYVYLCYGIHPLFNIVTNAKGIPHAVLIRSIEPVDGIEEMQKRRNFPDSAFKLTTGPGCLSKALGIETSHTGITLQSKQIWLEDTGNSYLQNQIIASPRIGVAYAKEDALLPYRFHIKDNPWVSKAK